MIDASPSFELEAFEQIQAVPGRALLRLTARATAGVTGDSLALVVDTPDAVHRLTPLPSPPDPSGLLRVAFSAPIELLARASAYGLELAGASAVELPAPTQGTRTVVRAGALTGAIAELEQQLEAEREIARQAQAELDRVQLSAEQAAEAQRANLERANADALEVARNFEQEAAAREEAERLAERLQAEHGELVVDDLRSQLEGALESARQARDELQQALAEAQTAATLAIQWQTEAERAQEAAGRALAEVQAMRAAGGGADGAVRGTEPDEVAPESDGAAAPGAPTDDAPSSDPRLADERTFADRQAANREVLRRAREGEREQTPRRASPRKTVTPKPKPAKPDTPRSAGRGGRPSGSDDRPSGSGGRGLVEARAHRPSAPRVSRASAPHATVRAIDEPPALSARLARVPLEVLFGVCLLVLGLMILALALTGAVTLGSTP